MQFPSWWLKRNSVSWLLWPLSLLFGLLVWVRRWAYRVKIVKSYRAAIPVIVVGNISVGGTGKTPLVIALVQHLKQQGLCPAIVSRGYKSQATSFPLQVTSETPVALAGDEPLLIAHHTQCTVMIDPMRVRAVKALEASGRYDIIICDDGLQHYALERELEIVVVDGKRQFGNEFLLPAGMLRESISRINNKNIVVCNGNNAQLIQKLSLYTANCFEMFLQPTHVQSLTDNQRQDLSAFSHQTAYAVAGIGNPERFFNILRANQINISEHPFPDHHNYSAADFTFRKDVTKPIIMTEKDAIKCKNLVYNAWYVEITACLPDTFYSLIRTELKLE